MLCTKDDSRVAPSGVRDRSPIMVRDRGKPTPFRPSSTAHSHGSAVGAKASPAQAIGPLRQNTAISGRWSGSRAMNEGITRVTGTARPSTTAVSAPAAPGGKPASR